MKDNAYVSYSVDDAVKYGVKEAIILNHFSHSLDMGCLTTHADKAGEFFRVDIQSLTKELPFFTVNQVRRALDNLVKDKAMSVSNFNETKMDRTRWFKINN